MAGSSVLVIFFVVGGCIVCSVAVTPPFRMHAAAPPFCMYRTFRCNTCLLYSDDHGTSWHVGAVGQSGSREASVAQLGATSQLYVTEVREHSGVRFRCETSLWEQAERSQLLKERATVHAV